MFLHLLKKLDNHLGRWSDQNLSTSTLFGIGDGLETIGEYWHAHHLDWLWKRRESVSECGSGWLAAQCVWGSAVLVYARFLRANDSIHYCRRGWYRLGGGLFFQRQLFLIHIAVIIIFTAVIIIIVTVVVYCTLRCITTTRTRGMALRLFDLTYLVVESNRRNAIPLVLVVVIHLNVQ